MGSDDQITVEVCYARADRQELIELRVDSDTTLLHAIEKSGIMEHYPEIDLTRQKVGVFGKLKSLQAHLTDGDRVEIYRPLVADPKEVRRLRAAAERK